MIRFDIIALTGVSILGMALVGMMILDFARRESAERLASCEAWQISAKRCNYCDEALARRPRACAIDKETRP